MAIDVVLFRKLRRRGHSIAEAGIMARSGIDRKQTWRQRNPDKCREMSRKSMATRRAAGKVAKAALAANTEFGTFIAEIGAIRWNAPRRAEHEGGSVVPAPANSIAR